jgi:MFS family permease
MPKVSGARPDYAGMLIIALAMIAFLYGVAQASGGIRNPAFLVPTLAGLVLFALYYVVERKVANPIFPPALFASGIFAAAAVSGIAWNFAQATVQLQTSNFWQYVQNFTPGEVALGQTAMMISFGAAGVLAGRLMKPGMRSLTLMGGGFVGLAGGLILLAFVVDTTPYWVMAIMLFIFGFGLAFVSVPQSALFVAEAPKSSFGPVTSFRTTVGQLGYAMGFAVSSALVGAFGTKNLIGRLEESGVPPSHIGKAIDDVRLFLRSGKDSSGETAKEAIADIGPAYAAGFNWAVGISGVAVGLLGVITILLLIIGMKQVKDQQNKSAS